ncbi:MAG: hypothetical protein JRH01_08875 [Deltaproteobacteria bacterium]|nr:hypothetical protein [Deltaproteobacteria bacterium]MBW2393681.1 hypothetical protein [Deltaproteobacteria bacterium]
MWTSHLVALLGLVLLLLAWLGVQSAWQRVFPETDPDPLAGRFGCGGAACPKQNESGGACPHAEEKA